MGASSSLSSSFTFVAVRVALFFLVIVGLVVAASTFKNAFGDIVDTFAVPGAGCHSFDCAVGSGARWTGSLFAPPAYGFFWPRILLKSIAFYKSATDLVCGAASDSTLGRSESTDGFLGSGTFSAIFSANTGVF